MVYFNNPIRIIVVFISFIFLLGLCHDFFVHDKAHCKENCYLCKIFYIGFDSLNQTTPKPNLFPFCSSVSFILFANKKLKSFLCFEHHHNRAPPLLTFFLI